MSARSECLANMIENAYPLFDRFLAGFDEANRTRQSPGIPNHAAWTLGHLALTASRGAERIEGHDDPGPLPEHDFVSGDGSAGDAFRFDTESVCFGSTPVDNPAIYPAWDRCVAVCRGAHDRLIAAARGATDGQLDRPVAWGSASLTAEQLGFRMAFHLGTHAGQIVDLRRGLGIGPLIK